MLHGNSIALWQAWCRAAQLVGSPYLPCCCRHPAFLGTVREEVVAQLRRIAHHASVAIWGGNNEVEVRGAQATVQCNSSALCVSVCSLSWSQVVSTAHPSLGLLATAQQQRRDAAPICSASHTLTPHLQASLDWYNQTRDNARLFAVDYDALFVQSVAQAVEQVRALTPARPVTGQECGHARLTHGSTSRCCPAPAGTASRGGQDTLER
jgi:beta-galactosidase/beta-glucuronidase